MSSSDALRAPRAVLAIDGVDGSGKSVLARRISATAATMGTGTVILAVDDFRRPVDWSTSGRDQADIYYEDYYDLQRLDGCLRAFLNGEATVQIPVFDSLSHSLHGQRLMECSGATLAIIEGVFAQRIPTVAADAPLIYLQTSFGTAHQRIVARDTGRGRTFADVSQRIATRYFPAQERYLREFDPAARAEVLIDNEDPLSPCLIRFDDSAVADRLLRQAAASSSRSVSAATAGLAGRVVALLSRACASFARPAPVG